MSITLTLKTVAVYKSNRGDKLDLPPSAFKRFQDRNYDFPYVFEICQPGARRRATRDNPAKIYTAGIFEFSARPGHVYTPSWLLEELDIKEGERMEIRLIRPNPPECKKLKLQPHRREFTDLLAREAGGDDFARESPVLNQGLRFFTALRQGNNVVIEWKGQQYKLEVVELGPKKTCLGSGAMSGTLEMQLEMMPAKDARARRERDEKERAAKDDHGGAVLDIWSDDDDDVGRGRSIGFVCAVCLHYEISKRDMVKHQVSCELINYRCTFPGCNKVVEKKQREEHDKTMHDLVDCECGLKLLRSNLVEHQKNRCSSRTRCPYCNQDKRIRGLFQHFQECGGRYERCSVCTELVERRDIVSKQHAQQCMWLCPCGARVPASEKDLHVASRCPNRMLKCRHCGKPVMAKERKAHQDSCLLNKRNQSGSAAGPAGGSAPSAGSGRLVDPQKLQTLMSLGYPEAQCRSALIQHDGDIDRAAMSLLS